MLIGLDSVNPPSYYQCITLILSYRVCPEVILSKLSSCLINATGQNISVKFLLPDEGHGPIILQ